MVISSQAFAATAAVAAEDVSLGARVHESIDPFIAVLDERRVQQGERVWTACVYGAHPVGDGWFLQIASPAYPTASLLLRIPHGATLAGAVATLERWQPSRDVGQTIMIVMPQSR